MLELIANLRIVLIQSRCKAHIKWQELLHVVWYGVEYLSQASACVTEVGTFELLDALLRASIDLVLGLAL